MNPTSRLLSILLLASLPMPTRAQSGAQPARAEPPLTLSALGDEIDVSLRWLRGRQDLANGSYGSVLETTTALEAFTTSPRAYRTVDGPFIGKALEFLLSKQVDSGAIADAGIDETNARLQTRLALRVLARCGANEEALARARAFVGEGAGEGTAEPEDPFAEQWKPLLEDADPARALSAKARALLATRGTDGSWESEHGTVLGTAIAISTLSSIHAHLKRLEAKPAPREAHALPAFDPADRARADQALERGAKFLLGEAIEPGRFGFEGRADPGITAMVVGALLVVPEPRSPEVERTIQAGLDWLVGLQRPDGSIHDGQLANYITSAGLMALARAARPKDAQVIERAREYLRRLQSDEGDGYRPSDRYYGGVGYGGDERPDLSNLQMALEALSEAGAAKGDETFTKALTFLQRCQNRSESNDLVLADGESKIVSGNDGGSGYAPGESKAGFVELPDGKKVPRSYGSMTYALLKGYLFAGLEKTDPRVQAAWGWITRNYTLDVNPGFEASSDPTAPYQGLFYYFTAMAKALDLYGEETIVDAAGVAHPWRTELAGRLIAMQRQNGSWVNENAGRWYEDIPVLATAYAMIALHTALPE
jgi:squalene-hopene/tetraprenyl-beta-curcumene cyclase